MLSQRIKSSISSCLLFIWLTCICNIAFATPLKWQTLANGLEYTEIPLNTGLFKGSLQAFRIDLNYYRIGLGSAADRQKLAATVKELVISHNALLGVNGGFFNPNFTPLGLRMQNGIITNPIKQISWWGIFSITNNQAQISSLSQHRQTKPISFAIQSGPRLVVNGKIPSLRPGTDDRTAIGITKDGKIIITVTDDIPLTTAKLASIMQASATQGGLDCYNALNLDGGGSTQLYANIGEFKLDLPGFSRLADSVLVYPR